ncbi:MAG: DUF2442 domain-containing protein [Candidatus Paraimprobicoccus trichonymphae]|uniref:DUF2442 domain-containing protein n=1 Tax=Candidatus Paraimprobicoccus trichonymphae TaxID=3033793 RepID=A0AA48L1P6_9FIRM|nr:MAG: DUF2442 domain-containing protein [Candidatus Paraimprobicoccus trichonymphae]
MIFHKLTDVKPISDLKLKVTFENGVIKVYDVKPLLDKWEVFKSFKLIRGLFEQVKLDCKGYGIAWNDDIDLSCEELWQNGTEYSYM